MDWVDIIAKVALPAIGLAGLIAAYVGWDIKKRSQRHDARRELVKTWRTELMPLLPTGDGDWSADEAKEQKVLEFVYYHSLRPHLPKDLVRRLEAPRTIVVAFNAPLVFGEQIARIERKWRLV